MQSFDVPILLLIFNRPIHTRQVLSRIRELKPTKIYLAADGPRPDSKEDESKCIETRSSALQMIDWNCEVNTLFQDRNLGCGRAPAQAITWFFQHVEEGIILEDDCLPTISFFYFSKRLLVEYRNNEKVMAISGFNYFETWRSSQYDYFFSDGGNWGWASWRRAWELFDYSMASWATIAIDRKKRIHDFYPNFHQIYQKIETEDFDAWDIQWHYARLYYDGLSITPSRNLVSNIGFDHSATHTSEFSSYLPKIKSFEIETNKPWRHPKELKLDILFRNKYINMFAGAEKTSIQKRIYTFVKRIILLIQGGMQNLR